MAVSLGKCRHKVRFVCQLPNTLLCFTATEMLSAVRPPHLVFQHQQALLSLGRWAHLCSCTMFKNMQAIHTNIHACSIMLSHLLPRVLVPSACPILTCACMSCYAANVCAADASVLHSCMLASKMVS
jgi:hypothetical protein